MGSDMSARGTTLPLFPLGTVLLPGMRLPLRIFEPRYVAMMTHLSREEYPAFGVVAIRRGHEVGSHRPDLFGVGCAAVPGGVLRTDGHLETTATGVRRFRLDAVHDDRAPYLVGDVTWLDGSEERPDETQVPDVVTTRAAVAFTAFAEAVGGRVAGLPDEPLALTASILDGLGQPLPVHQAVLESGDAAARLRAVTRLSRQEEALARVLHCRSAKVTPSSRLSPN